MKSPTGYLQTPLSQNIGVALAYLATAELGFLLALEQTNATAVWPPTGIALAACLIFGYHVWPGIFLGAVGANLLVLSAPPLLSLATVPISCATAAGNTLEAVVGAYLVKRFMKGTHPLDRIQDASCFILLGALASPVISATIGTASFSVYGADWSRSGPMWLTWWLGDAVGALVFAPLLIAWEQRTPPVREKKSTVEVAALLALVLLVELIVFRLNVPLEYLIFPILFWTAFRFGQFGSAATVAVVMVTFLYWTVKGFGPFVAPSRNYTLLFLQSYLGVASASTLLLSTLISTRNRAEEALRASEEKFRTIFEQAPIGIFRSTVEGRFSSLNGTLAAMFSYPSPEEMIRDVSNIAEQLFVLPGQRKIIMEKARNSEHFVHEEVVYRRKDGTDFIATLYMRMLCDTHGALADLEGFVEDITGRKRAEDRLRDYQDNLEKLVDARTAELTETNERLIREIEERARAEQMLIEREEQYRDLVESANCVILRWLPDGRITFFNRFAQDFFGYREEEIIGRNIVGTVVPTADSAGHELASLAKAIVEHPEAYARNENENVRRNGERVWVAWTNKPILNRSGSIAEILSIGIDITQSVHTEQELRRALEALAVAKEHAETADRIKSAFLATMSHELRTPLNSIIGFTGILLQGLSGPINDEQTRQLTMVKNSANHLLSLISDVLDISKIEAGQLAVTCAPLDLKASIFKVVQIVRPMAEKKGLSLEVDIVAAGSAYADERRVEQVLLNLLSNAVKFTEQGGVTVRCAREGGCYVTSVADTGIGIKSDDLEYLFKPFHQIDSGLSRKYEGTGLGLSICRRLAELMGGEVGVRSEHGAGSTFWFTVRADGAEQHPAGNERNRI